GWRVSGGSMTITRDEWQQVKRIAADALAQPVADRSAYVAAQCGADEALRREVASLLAAAVSAADLYEQPAVAIAGASAFESLQQIDTAPPGGRVGPYRIVRALGRGGMGAVYFAERADGEYEQEGAIKIVAPGAAGDALIRRFRASRQILAGLDHPN